MTELFIVKMENKDFSVPDYMWELADCEKRTSIKKIRRESEQKTRLYAHVFVKIILGEKLSLAPSKIKISYLQNGKPYVENCPLKFNISHTENAFAVSISDNETGVDIEKTRSVDLALCNRFFTENERKLVFKNDIKLELEKRFFYVWTRKEAFLKYTGEGISGLKTTDTESPDLSSMLKTFTEGEYTVSLCFDDKGLEKVVLTEEELITKFDS
ncbi:MAG: 4'-phosphopantetheinyl transferase superfamily protein [Ruminococcaceae bacterium]|nr:4'-phosphopantetheinyl transferase superfamily protein [Oscillospiraceae bacterium]